MQTNSQPVFIRGLSRSGGTLLVTMLDAHPEIAMSYELYPNLLEVDDDSAGLEGVVDVVAKAKNLKKAARKVKSKSLSTFLLRCARGGLEIGDMRELLKTHLACGRDFHDIEGRLAFIESCCKVKMARESKNRWGSKCTGAYAGYLSYFPKAYFLNIIRDGRDVLASQMNTGSFKATPESMGRSWSNTHANFKKLIDRDDVNAYAVIYEKLVSEPESELQKICSFLEVPFDVTMLDYYKRDLTIYNADHLSMNRISKPVDEKSVGRWKKELNGKQIEIFCSVARDVMTEYGYL